jgi:hypothetical protein
MASKKRFEQPLSPTQARAVKFMGARLRESEARYQEYLETLDPRQREALSFDSGRE